MKLTLEGRTWEKYYKERAWFLTGIWKVKKYSQRKEFVHSAAYDEVPKASEDIIPAYSHMSEV